MIFLGEFNQIGKSWLAVINYIAKNGVEICNKDECYTETKGISLRLNINKNFDPILAKYSNPQNIVWMKENFEIIQTVTELKNANSYAERLYNYAGSKNQIDWVIEKIKQNENVRSATITTFEPLTDKNYIPCISLLDFDISDDRLNVYVYARALDFGTKAYANLICINDILKHIAKQIHKEPGMIHLLCKSAHVYKQDYSLMHSMIADPNL